jgi:hypothetical protein
MDHGDPPSGRPPVAFSFYRHAEIPSHRGDLPATSGGLRHAEAVGAEVAASCAAATRFDFLHAPTLRTVQTAEALRTGVRRGLRAGAEAHLGEPRVEPAIRNPDLYVAGHRVEMVSAREAVAAQLPDDALTAAELERHGFFSRFLTSPDRIGLWVADDDRRGRRRRRPPRPHLGPQPPRHEPPPSPPLPLRDALRPDARAPAPLRPRPRPRRAGVRRARRPDVRGRRVGVVALPRRDGRDPGLTAVRRAA